MKTNEISIQESNDFLTACLGEELSIPNMSNEKKKKLGAFYTPKHTVDFMLEKFGNPGPRGTLLEPSGGDGAFVSQILQKKFLKPSQITVWDIDPGVKKTINELGIDNFARKDTLLETEFDNDLFSRSKKFSFVIGNPPYLNKQSQYIKKNKKRLGKKFSRIGANDTYAMFLYLGCKLLEENGQLCFIISDTYLTLGIHKKLRKFLLENYTINEITLCPKNLFRDTGALVNTSIIYLTNKKPIGNHSVVFNDCRENEVGDYAGKKYKTVQKNILNYPDHIFDFNGGAKLLGKIVSFPNTMEFLEGGLGMHTTDNDRFLAVVDYDGLQYAKNNGIKEKIPVQEVDGKKWKFYHKKGGNQKYYLPAEYAIRWDASSRKSYKMPANYDTEVRRKGFIISGICSSLTARLSTPGALWESNKAMCFFPKDPKKYPAEFFVGILNSQTYGSIIKLLNHTSSMQIRDIKKLPLPNFKKNEIAEIVQISKGIIRELKKDLNYDFSSEQKKIDDIVNNYFK